MLRRSPAAMQRGCRHKIREHEDIAFTQFTLDFGWGEIVTPKFSSTHAVSIIV